MIYISGRITGITNYMWWFANAEKKLKEIGYKEVVNPARTCLTLPELSHDDYMTVCMALLSLCDSIYMLKGYERSKGAMQELEYAKEHGYEILKEE